MLLNYFIVEVYVGESLVGYVDQDYNVVGPFTKGAFQFEWEYFATAAAEITYEALLAQQEDNKKIKVVVKRVQLVPQLDTVTTFGPLEGESHG